MGGVPATFYPHFVFARTAARNGAYLESPDFWGTTLHRCDLDSGLLAYQAVAYAVPLPTSSKPEGAFCEQERAAALAGFDESRVPAELRPLVPLVR